jgi:hypothetical protein
MKKTLHQHIFKLEPRSKLNVFSLLQLLFLNTNTFRLFYLNCSIKFIDCEDRFHLQKVVRLHNKLLGYQLKLMPLHEWSYNVSL